MSDADIPEPDALNGIRHPRLTPQLFGQDAAEATFMDAYNSARLHHGWLITGPSGVGKATLAWRIARFLLSQTKQPEADLLGAAPPASTLNVSMDTPVSRRVSALAEPRLILCRRGWDDKRRRLKTVLTIDEVRKLISFFHLSSADGGHRVAIIDSVDEMNTSAANALLKLLEEPPAKSTLLLISHSPMGLLPTIRSRCRTLACKPLGAQDMAQALQGLGYASDIMDAQLGILAGGSVGEAIRILSDDGLTLYNTLVALLARPGHMDRQQAIKLAESCIGTAGIARYDLCLRLLGTLLHRLAIAGLGAAGLPSADAEILNRLSPDPRASRRWAGLAAELSARSLHARAVNLDPASVILDMLIKIDRTAAGLVAA